MAGRLENVLATDCGSTTTKAVYIERREEGYRLASRGEAPTTVEAPFEDVTRGVVNSVEELEELTGRSFLEDGGTGVVRPKAGDTGVDAYVSTSSAGGGLQMLVAGVVKEMTAESAHRAALGAGAIVMDVLAINDGRRPWERIELIRNLRPDMILLSGGTDGGDVNHVVEMAEVIKEAKPRPRLGTAYRLPVIFAGNADAREEVERLLGESADLFVVDNLRPTLERENLGPAREKIHELFMEHVMQQAPGYPRLIDWTDAPIMPTPGAVGSLIERVAEVEDITVIGVDIGGATTDIFSVFQGTFNRTVSANLGLSYSVSQVLAEAGWENVMRWVPFTMDEADLRDRIKNKMVRPTTVPQSLRELIVEQALAREALRLSFHHHRSLAVGLKGVQQQRTIAEAFSQSQAGASLIDLAALDLLVGSGGVLSHAPRRVQAAAMLVDAFQPVGVTELAVDSIFMMPHLGVLSTINPAAAVEVFEADCLIRLGTCVAPFGPAKPGEPVLEVALPAGQGGGFTLHEGEMRLVELGVGEEVAASLKPVGKRLDVGGGPGQEVKARLTGGQVGLVFDGRGRPLILPEDDSARIKAVTGWHDSLGLYPSLEGLG